MRSSSLILVAALLAFPAMVRAQGCTVSAGSLNFGPYDHLATAPLDSTAAVRVTCQAGIAYTLKLDAGVHSSGAFEPRYMSLGSGTFKMAYLLSTNAAFTRIWGDGQGGSFTMTGMGTGAPQTFIVYGRILPHQNLKPGLYSDAVRMTLEY